jgi:hypothetical protein
LKNDVHVPVSSKINKEKNVERTKKKFFWRLKSHRRKQQDQNVTFSQLLFPNTFHKEISRTIENTMYGMYPYPAKHTVPYKVPSIRFIRFASEQLKGVARQAETYVRNKHVQKNQLIKEQQS